MKIAQVSLTLINENSEEAEDSRVTLENRAISDNDEKTNRGAKDFKNENEIFVQEIA